MSEPYECIACGREWQDHPGVEPTCKLACDLASTLKQLLTYVQAPEYTRDITEQEVYSDLMEKAQKLIRKARNFSSG